MRSDIAELLYPVILWLAPLAHERCACFLWVQFGDRAAPCLHLLINSVANPNWFDADFKKVSAEVKYNGGQFGGGQINNVNFKAYRVSTFDFPFYLK